MFNSDNKGEKLNVRILNIHTDMTFADMYSVVESMINPNGLSKGVLKETYRR